MYIDTNCAGSHRLKHISTRPKFDEVDTTSVSSEVTQDDRTCPCLKCDQKPAKGTAREDESITVRVSREWYFSHSTNTWYRYSEAEKFAVVELDLPTIGDDDVLV